MPREIIGEHEKLESSIERESYVPFVAQCRLMSEYTVWIKFDNGVEGTIDLSDLAQRPGKFSSLKDNALFSQIESDPVFGNITWPNGLEFDPESLYLRLQKKAE